VDPIAGLLAESSRSAELPEEQPISIGIGMGHRCRDKPRRRDRGTKHADDIRLLPNLPEDTADFGHGCASGLICALVNKTDDAVLLDDDRTNS
jgi:hypothetical protein